MKTGKVATSLSRESIMQNDNLRFNKNEQEIISYFSRNLEQEITVDQLANHIYCGTTKPRCWRNSLLSRLRILRLKCESVGDLRISRTTRLGVSSKAKFIASRKQ
jgi:hypothetical protein